MAMSESRIFTKYLKHKLYRTHLKPIANGYFISVDGDVYSNKIHRRYNQKGKMQMVKPKKQKDRRYLLAGLYTDPFNKQKKYWYRIHRLVWEAFVGPIPEGYEIHHRDHNCGNNALWNLNCVTHKENVNEYWKWKKKNTI
jgi:hypothetical protein